MESPLFVLYTHTDCKDVWPAFFGQTDKYLGPFDKVIFVNKEDLDIPENYRVIIYSDKLAYTERLAHCLQQITEPYILIQHEDMFLYDSPNIDRVTSYPSIMNHHGIDCIKLLKGGEKSDIPFYKYDGLKEISNTSRWSFAIQPTIWNTKSYLKLCENISNQSIWEFERNGQQVFKDLHMRALYTYRGEPKRGKHHWDSSVFPYIATAIGKGKWNFGEYKKELTVILEEYNIDYAIRGIF